MAKKIFIAATGQNCGKTTTSIGLMHLAMKKYGRVGFIKPMGPKPALFKRCTVDKDAALIAQVFGLEKDMRWMSPVVVLPDTTRRFVDGETAPGEFQERIMAACGELEKR
jgi:BioD-like phosphotransacetylase family protein